MKECLDCQPKINGVVLEASFKPEAGKVEDPAVVVWSLDLPTLRQSAPHIIA